MKKFSQWSTKAKRWFLFATALFLILAAFGGGWAGGYFSVDDRARNLSWMIDTVAANYYQEVDEAELYDDAYDALVRDRFCSHYTPEEYAKLLRESDGVNEGYGLSFLTEGETTRLYRVVGNSPAALAGLVRGMYVFAYGSSAEDMKAGTGEEIVSFLNGRDSCVLSCGRKADGSDATNVTVERASSYSAAYCGYADSEGSFEFRGEKQLTLTQTGEGLSALGADTAYIRFDRFEGNAAREFLQCLQQMKARGRKNLIIDLRGNGGGYLSILCDVASHLLKNAEGRSPLIMTAKYRDGKTEEYHANGNDFGEYFDETSRIRVFADENSASASEALLGAMLDYGTISYSDIYLREETARTYGKGVMQSTYVAPDGNAMRLTVAEIFWPKGNSIHGKGITCSDGALAVDAPMLPAAEDAFLQALQ